MRSWGPPQGEVEDSGNSPTMVLEETVGRLQRDLEELQLENRFLKTPKAVKSVPLVRQAAFTTTKVPWFDGSTSWKQYLQVFEAIVLSNGWGDATAALQLLSHLQVDALSVALLTPLPLQATRKELTDALSSHYGSPGRLANYRREFDKTVREMGEDPSNFAIKLETLAVKAFGNMGQVARLRLIQEEEMFAVVDRQQWNTQRVAEPPLSPELQQMFALARRMGYEMRPIARRFDAPRQTPGPRSSQNKDYRAPFKPRDYSRTKCFSCGQLGHTQVRCPKPDSSLPFRPSGWVDRSDGPQRNSGGPPQGNEI